MAEVTEVIQEAKDIKTLKLNLENPISFKAGQFLMITAEIEEKQIKRAYSFSHYSKSQPTKTVYITFDLIPAGKMSTYLYNLSVGENLEVAAPYGVFTLEENLNEVVFIAGGTGISPLMSMLEQAIGTNIKASLIYSVKNPESMCFKTQLEALKNQKKLDFSPTITRETKQEWTGNRGRIDKDFIKQSIKTGNEHFYICGPAKFVEISKQYLEELGISKEKIHVERW